MEFSTEFCRVCLESNQHLNSIYTIIEDEFLPYVIWNITGVKIKRCLEPMALVCSSCSAQLLAAEKIILRCQESAKYLAHIKEAEPSKPTEAVPTEAVSTETLEDNLSNNSEMLDEIPPVEDNVDIQIELAHPEDTELCESDNTGEIAAESAKVSTKRQRRRKPTDQACFRCDLCEFMSKIGRQLKVHQLEEHGIDDPRIYKCQHCTERFAHKPKLYRHIQDDHNILPAEKKYVCKKCDKAYIRNAHLTEHIKQKHKPRSFKCAEPNCEQRFSRAFTLRRHYLAMHTNQSRYRCAKCDKYFKIYDLWKYHNEVVHKNEIIYCPKCGYPFRHKQKLDEHLQKNVCRKSVIPCPYCQRRFTRKSGLKEHLRKIHEILED